MLPYMLAAHKPNYSRSVRSVTWLPADILDKFCHGEQSLYQVAGLINGMWSDMYIETTWMRKGHGPGGIIGITEHPQVMAMWVHSMDATMSLITDLKKLSGGAETETTKHKEESSSCIDLDGRDRKSLNMALKRCINPLDPDSHAAGCLLNISTGEISNPQVNVDTATEIGVDLHKEFEASWPEGFYNPIQKKVVTFAGKKKTLHIGASVAVDPEAIYARVSGLLVSERDLEFLKEVLSTELTPYPPPLLYMSLLPPKS